MDTPPPAPRSTCVPHLVTGFEGLLTRVGQQRTAVDGMATAATQLRARATAAGARAGGDARLRLERARHVHLGLSQRLLRVMRMLEILQARGCGSFPQEAAFRARVEAIARGVRAQRGVQELTAAVREAVEAGGAGAAAASNGGGGSGAAAAPAGDPSLAHGGGGGGGDGGGALVADPAAMRECITQQQAAIRAVMDVVRRDAADVEGMASRIVAAREAVDRARRGR
jgi:hypothetical protein